MTTTTTREDVIHHLLTDKYYEDVLPYYLSDYSERNEFRQELWLILLSKSDSQLIKWYDTKILKYIYVGIINNQIKSSTSPWHVKHRNNRIGGKYADYNENKDIRLEDFDSVEKILTDKEIKIQYIEDKLKYLESKDPYLKRDITIFRMHFYDKLSYRKITKLTKISTSSVYFYVNNVLFLLRKDKNEIEDDIN